MNYPALQSNEENLKIMQYDMIPNSLRFPFRKDGFFLYYMGKASEMALYLAHCDFYPFRSVIENNKIALDVIHCLSEVKPTIPTTSFRYFAARSNPFPLMSFNSLSKWFKSWYKRQRVFIDSSSNDTIVKSNEYCRQDI